MSDQVEALNRAALTLIRFAKMKNVEVPVLTVSPAFFSALQAMSIHEAQNVPHIDGRTSICSLPVEVDNSRRRWEK